MAGRFVLLAAMSMLAGCRPAAETAVGPPVAAFEFERRDLGDISIAPRGRVVEFPVVNHGLSDLRLLKVVRSCTCVDSSVSRSVLKPGESGLVALAIAPERAEEKSADVSVHTNDPANPVVRLSVSWRAHSPVEIEPLQVDFGRLRPGQTVQRKATIRRHGAAGEARAVTAVTAVTAGPAGQVLASRDGDEITLSVTAGASPGPGHGELTVELGAADDRLNVPLRWQVADVIEVQPRELMAGSGGPGERATGRVVISAEPGSRLEIDEIRWEGGPEADETATTWRRLTHDRALAEVAWRLPAEPGAHRGELVIACEKPERRTFRVPVSAYVLGAEVAAKEGRR